MATYGDMKSRILRELNRDDLTDAASAAIHTAIAYYENQRFWFNEQRALLTSIDGQEFYRLPSDYVSYDSLKIRSGTSEYKIERVDHDTIVGWVSENPPRESRPTHFSVYADQIRCYPTPDVSTYVFVLSYVRKLPALTGDTSSNEWTSTAESLIRAHAERDIAGNVLHDPQLASMYETYMIGEERSLRVLTNAKLTSGRAKRYDFPAW